MLTRNKSKDGKIRLKTKGEIEAMRQAGMIVAEALRAMRDAIVPDQTTTLQLDEIAGEVLKMRGARAPLNGYKPSFSEVPYLHNTCISVNDAVIHGVPSGKRVLRTGDIVSLDMDASIDGWCADATITVPVGEISPKARHLLSVTREALHKGVEQARPGRTIGDIGFTVQKYVERNGCSVVRDMVGHGIGQTPHEPGLDVPNHGRSGKGLRLLVGMTFCIEPMVNLGKEDVEQHVGDSWTIYTADGSLSAHFEHTVAVTENGPEVLTAPPKTS